MSVTVGYPQAIRIVCTKRSCRIKHQFCMYVVLKIGSNKISLTVYNRNLIRISGTRNLARCDIKIQRHPFFDFSVGKIRDIQIILFPYHQKISVWREHRSCVIALRNAKRLNLRIFQLRQCQRILCIVSGSTLPCLLCQNLLHKTVFLFQRPVR